LADAGASRLARQVDWGKLLRRTRMENDMDIEEERKRPRSHEVGMMLDALSVEELADRIALLEGEIARIRVAMEAKGASRKAAEAAFKF
jgi:uncharacterized small protein (DUF1192 family)